MISVPFSDIHPRPWALCNSQNQRIDTHVVTGTCILHAGWHQQGHQQCECVALETRSLRRYFHAVNAPDIDQAAAVFFTFNSMRTN